MKDAAGTPLNCAGVVVEHFLSPFYSSASPDISSTVSLSLSLSLNCQLPILMPWIQTSSIALSVLSFYFQFFYFPHFSSLLKAYLSLLFFAFSSLVQLIFLHTFSPACFLPTSLSQSVAPFAARLSCCPLFLLLSPSLSACHSLM